MKKFKQTIYYVTPNRCRKKNKVHLTKYTVRLLLIPIDWSAKQIILYNQIKKLITVIFKLHDSIHNMTVIYDHIYELNCSELRLLFKTKKKN